MGSLRAGLGLRPLVLFMDMLSAPPDGELLGSGGGMAVVLGVRSKPFAWCGGQAC